MEENANNAEEIEEDLEEDQPDEEKKFSQGEVNEIVKKRLQREREKMEDEFSGKLEEASATADDDLIQREIAVSCKEFLISNNYPLELLDIIGADDVTKFQEKVTQLDGLLKPRANYPAYSNETGVQDSIRGAFSPDARHKPKDLSW